MNVRVSEWIKVEQVVKVPADEDGGFDEQEARAEAFRRGTVEKDGHAWEIVDSQGIEYEVVEEDQETA